MPVGRSVGWGRVGVTAVVVALGALALAGPAATAWAQASATRMVGPRLATRAELEATLDSLRRELDGTASSEERRRLASQVSGLEHRLQEGDLWPGDVLSVVVRGEAQWTDDFTLTPARSLELPNIPPVPMEGVLYAETEERLREVLGTYLREPDVRVTPLKRVAVLGAVSDPGFYAVRGSLLLSEVIMRAGGPAQNAKVNDLKVRRSGRDLEIGRPAVAFETLSLDQLGILSGDEVFVPASSGVGFWGTFLGVVGGVTSVAFLITRL